MLSLDPTTLAEYLVSDEADARAQAVMAAFTGTVYVRVYDGSDTLMGEGTMAAPWATRSGSTITVGELASFSVLANGTPNAASWYLRLETAGGRWIRGPFGPGGSFTWSLGTWRTEQAGQIGTVTLNAQGLSGILGAAFASSQAAANLYTSGTPYFTIAPTSAVIASSGGVINFSAVDPNFGAITYTLSSRYRNDITIDSSGGAVSVPPEAAGTAGSITVRATDPSGLYADASCAVTVQAGNWEITEAFNNTTLASPWYDDTSIALGTMPILGGSCYRVSWGDLEEGQPTTPAPRQGASRIQFAASDEVWFRSRVCIDNSVRTGHLFYFKLSSADQWEAPTAGGAVYFEPYNGNFQVLNRDESGAWINPTGAATSTNIADGQPHELVIRMVLNSVVGGVAQSNGIIQVWIDGTQRVNTSNWRFRTNATSKLNQFLLGPYRQTYTTGAGSMYVDNISLSNTGAAPQTGTTYFAWSGSSLSYETSPVAPYQAQGGFTLVSDEGRNVGRFPISDGDFSVGFGTIGPFPLGSTIYGKSFFFRTWFRFEAGFSWGNIRGRSKFMRLGQPGESPMLTVNMTSGLEGGNGLWFEWDSVDALPNQYLTYNFNPATDATLFNWNEFILEMRQRSSSSASDGYARLYRNGTLVSTLSNQIWTNRTGAWYAMWGSFGTVIHPQLNYPGQNSGGGGYIRMKDQTLTDFFYSTY